jgi:succinoglycan biosynthesis transport protein ExoP
VPNSDSPDAAGQAKAPFDPREYLRSLLAHKWIALSVAALVTAGVAAWTMRQPLVYEAICSIEYDTAPLSPLGDDIDDVGGTGAAFFASREFLETQNRVLASRGVAERVVRRLNLAANAEFLNVPRGGFRPWSVELAAEELQRRVTVEPIRQTRIALVRVRDRNPERARLIANTIVDAYIEKTMEDRLGTTVSALEWLSSQLDTLREQLERSELALHHFKEENNLLSVSMEDRQNLVSVDIQNLSTSLIAARTKHIELSARLTQLRRVASQPAIDARSTPIDTNPAISTLRESLRAKIAERGALSARYGEAHPQMTALQGSIEALESQLRAEIDGLVRAAAADVAEAQSIESGLRAALDEANRAGLEVNLREIEYGRLSRERENTAKLYGVVLSRTTETDLTRMLKVANARVVDRSLAPRTPVSPRVLVNLSVGLAVGLFLGIGVASALARFDRRIKSVADVEDLGVAVLGIMPAFAGSAVQERASRRKRAKPDGRSYLTVHNDPKSAAAECCRTIRTNLAFMSADAPLRSLVVTSASPADGKTTIAVSLSIAIAQSLKTTLLVDTDLRRPKVHKAFGMSSAKGITSVLVGEAAFEDVVQTSEVPGLDVIPCGPIPPNPAELLQTAKFREFLATALQRYDRVIFDSSPIGAVVDAAVVAPQTDGVVVVARSEHTTRDALASVLRQLRGVTANVRGCVVNNVDFSATKYGYGSYYYYSREGYYSADETPNQASEADA